MHFDQMHAGSPQCGYTSVSAPGRVPPANESRVRELALFNLGIDSKLRGCDLVALKVRDVCHGDQLATRAIVMQHKTQRPVQFEITQATRDALQTWIKQAGLKPEDFLFPSWLHGSPHLGARQYARILGHWVDELGLDSSEYGTHSMRRTKATLIYRRTKNLRAVQLPLGQGPLSLGLLTLGGLHRSGGSAVPQRHQPPERLVDDGLGRGSCDTCPSAQAVATLRGRQGRRDGRPHRAASGPRSPAGDRGRTRAIEVRAASVSRSSRRSPCSGPAPSTVR